MRKFLIIFSYALSALLIAYVMLDKTPERKRLQAPPDFSFLTMQGEAHRLSEYKGKPVLLHFWATWCQPCVFEFPQLIKTAKDNPELVVLAVSVDNKKSAIEKFLKPLEVPANFYIIHDRERKISYDLFRSMNYPETILIGCDFKMQGKVIGVAEDWPGTAKDLLNDCTGQTTD